MPNSSLEQLFSQAAEAGASDLHLVAGQPPVIRLHGALKPINEGVLNADVLQKIVYGILSPEIKTKLEKNRELDTSYQISDGTRFRVNVFYEKGNLSLAARVIPTTIPSPEELYLPEVAQNLTKLNHGLVLVTGPTGSGKSTSIASLIEMINQQRNLNIITLEDPIEFLFESKKSLIQQRQLGTDMLSFAEGLKHVLRQDPNVIMIGEMRDLETISTTLTLAETGHLVFATLHTNNAAETIDRIVDVFPPHKQNQVRLQLSLSLQAVVSQRLLPLLAGGRRAAFEVLINNPAVANLIRENKIGQIKSVIQTSADQGMITLERSVKDLLQQGLINEEIASRHINLED
ncbi:type IV pilus twitching motility protein PilT [Patescibacteria group bacterium]|nr:type IV pilus twitching motility protein PilT [Patescibacteria group bacterium]